MAIELDTSRLSSAAANLSGADAQNAADTLKKLAPLLGGSSLNVSSAAMSDLEALVARLKNDSEKTKFSLLLSSLHSISESLTVVQKEALEEGLKLYEQLSNLEKELAGLSDAEKQAKADVVVIQTRIQMLEKQIEQAIEEGKDHRELAAELKAARKEFDEKNDVIANTQGRIAAVKNEISRVTGKIAAIVKSIEPSTLKTIASEIADIAKPEKAESNAEKEKKAEKEEAVDLLKQIRDSLDRIGRELADTIERNVDVMV